MELSSVSYLNFPPLEAMIELWTGEMRSSLSLRHRSSQSQDVSAARIESYLKNMRGESLSAGDFIFVSSEEGDLCLQNFDPEIHDLQQTTCFNRGPVQILLQKLHQLQQFLVDLPFESAPESPTAFEEKRLFRAEIQALQHALLSSELPSFDRLLSYLRIAKGRLLNRIDMPLSVRGKILNQVRRTVDPESIETDIHNREVEALVPGHRTHSKDHEFSQFPYPVYAEKALRKLIDLELLILAWQSEVFPN